MKTSANHISPSLGRASLKNNANQRSRLQRGQLEGFTIFFVVSEDKDPKTGLQITDPPSSHTHGNVASSSHGGEDLIHISPSLS